MLSVVNWPDDPKTHWPIGLDLPSGVDATTGETLGEFVCPRWTLTLALPKIGLLPAKTGTLFLADVGIPERAYYRIGVTSFAPFGDRFWVPLSYR